MRISKIFPFISILTSVFFTTIACLAYPLWSSIRQFLGTNLPVMPILALVGILFAGYSFCLFSASNRKVKVHPVHLIILLVVDIVMSVLLYVLFDELGYERAILARNAAETSPVAAWFLAAFLFVWFAPRWKPLSNKGVRFGLIALLAIAAVIWTTYPWRIKMTTQPAVYRQQDGLVFVWGTNMVSTSWLNYGSTQEMDQTASNQVGGLLSLGDRLQWVFLPYSQITSDLYFQALSEGIHSFNLTNVVKVGKAASDLVHVQLPAQDDEIFMAAFSDLHEHPDRYQQLAGHIPWEDVDEAVFLGDLVNYVTSPEQVAQQMVSLPTGGKTIPRVFVRGNHETRGEDAAQFGNWLKPHEAQWYYSFSAGNVFFVVLDSGEDKIDSHPEYSGMNDFASYHQEQAEWLSRVFDSQDYQDAVYRVILVHIPPFVHPVRGGGFTPPEFGPVLSRVNNQEDIDLIMSGHIHEGGIWMPDETGFPHPVVTAGGQEEYDMAAIIVYFGVDGIEIEVLDINGNLIEQALISKK